MKLRDLAVTAPPEKLEVFTNMLRDFENNWRQRLTMRYQQAATSQHQLHQIVQPEQQEVADPIKLDDIPDPNASPPIITVQTGLKLESL